MKRLYTIALALVFVCSAAPASAAERTNRKPAPKTTSKTNQRIDEALRAKQDPRRQKALSKDLQKVEKVGSELGKKLDAQLNGGKRTPKKRSRSRTTR